MCALFHLSRTVFKGMATGPEAGHAPALELAHVLFMDVVAYSRLSTDQQERVLRQLQGEVRGTAEFARAQAADQLISLPTGDGMALVFFGDPESPVRCARELAAALRDLPEIPLRMGVHTGPVYRVQDINANRNVAGGGINFAQRVMDCADAGHILVSRATADVLRQISGWDALLHDLGEAEVKHGVKVQLVNLYGEGFGNRVIPSKLRAAVRKRRTRSNAVAAAALVITAAAGLAAFYYARRAHLRVNVVTEKPRRSVAVLGFRNLSGRADAAWLSTALSQMLTTELAAGEQLRAVPGETVAQAKIDLALPNVDALSKETLDRVHKRIGADLVVLGSYLDLGEGKRKLRVDVRGQDAAEGETIMTATAEGSEDSLFDIVTRCGSDLRAELGVGKVSSGEAVSVKASLPANADAARLYAEGLARLRVFDALGARDLLQQAVQADPKHALAQAALSAAWTRLGYLPKAAESAQRALDLGANLSREDKLSITGQYAIARHDWPKAIETYQTLFTFFPDNVEYGLQLASAQQLAGKGKDALATVTAMRKLPPPLGDDPRIDLAEGDAKESLADNRAAMAAYTSAASKANGSGARLVLAKALANQGWLHRAFGEPTEALAALHQAQDIYASTGDRGALAKVLGNIGVLLRDKPDYVGSRAMFEQSLSVAREIGDSIHVAVSLNSLANLLREQGDLAGARPLFEEALRTSRENGDRYTAIAVEGNFAGLLFDEGNVAGAKQLRQQAIDDAHEAGDPSAEAISLGGLGDTLYFEGNLTGALDAYQRALAIFKHASNRQFQALAVQKVADTMWAQGKLDEARAGYRDMQKIYADMGDLAHAMTSKIYVDAAQVDGGNPQAAIPALRDAAAESRKVNADDSEIVAETYLAKGLLETGDTAGAAQEFARVRTLTGKEGMNLSTTILGARIDAAQGRADAALKTLQSLLRSPDARGQDEQLQTRLGMAQIEFQAGRPEGRLHLEQVAKDAAVKGFGLVARQANDALKRRRG